MEYHTEVRKVWEREIPIIPQNPFLNHVARPFQEKHRNLNLSMMIYKRSNILDTNMLSYGGLSNGPQ